MIPYDIDPSLHTAEPEPQRLEDGFSPRHPQGPGDGGAAPQAPVKSAETLGDKSAF